jgi:hypothetical protein
MIRRALAVAVGLFGVCFLVTAQQANRPGATEDRTVAFQQFHAADALDPAFALSLYQPKIFGANDNSLLFHKGPVRAWSDGGRLASETALASIGMAPLDPPPLAYLTPNTFGPEPRPTKKGTANSNSRSVDVAEDEKDFSGEMISAPSNRIYYTGEVGFLYGHWSGNGSGDVLQSYVWGEAGNDKFQITAGASYDEWSGNGRGLRFRSFAAPR